MPELNVHFAADEGTNLSGAAAALKGELDTTSGIHWAEISSQSFQSGDAAEVLGLLQIGTQVLQSSAAFLTALAAVYAAWQKVKVMFPKLHPPTVEVGLEQVPVDQLTEAHRAELVADLA